MDGEKRVWRAGVETVFGANRSRRESYQGGYQGRRIPQGEPQGYLVGVSWDVKFHHLSLDIAGRAKGIAGGQRRVVGLVVTERPRNFNNEKVNVNL